MAWASSFCIDVDDDGCEGNDLTQLMTCLLLGLHFSSYFEGRNQVWQNDQANMVFALVMLVLQLSVSFNN